MKKLLGHYNFINQLEQRYDELSAKTKACLSRMESAPQGTLLIAKSNGRIQYYVRNKNEKTGTYISAKNTSLILKLAQKKYDLAFLKSANQELKTIKRFLDSYSDEIADINSLFPAHILNNIDFADMSDKDYLAYWTSISYEPKHMDDDVPVHITLKGERVRSKSEELIANILYRLNIPYKYECPLIFGNGSVRYPDFTLLDIITRRTIYYEHFGMMDNEDYSSACACKINDYALNGFFLGYNLIATFETSIRPINSFVIEGTLKRILNLQ